jgi:Peptidase S24-like
MNREFSYLSRKNPTTMEVVMDDVRTNLDRLCKEQGEDYTSLSRLLGRNPAYVQQFMKRGTPRKLDEADRAKLARYFGVDEALLGAPLHSGADDARRAPGGKAPQMKARHPMVMVQQFSIGASAGPGAVVGIESHQNAFGFEERWLRAVSSQPDAVSMIQVMGDSMAPTLFDGDDILVDRSKTGTHLRDGIYVLRFDDVLMVKRLALNPAARRISIRSDNPSYPGWEDCDPDAVDVIGRVVWIGRRI